MKAVVFWSFYYYKYEQEDHSYNFENINSAYESYYKKLFEYIYKAFESDYNSKEEINNIIENEILPRINEIKNKSPKDINRDPAIVKLRNEFKSNLWKEFDQYRANIELINDSPISEDILIDLIGKAKNVKDESVYPKINLLDAYFEKYEDKKSLVKEYSIKSKCS